jgi:hypothetical protein
MTTALIGFLTVTTLLLAKLWRDMKMENAGLRSEIALLKRRLARSARG